MSSTHDTLALSQLLASLVGDHLRNYRQLKKAVNRRVPSWGLALHQQQQQVGHRKQRKSQVLVMRNEQPTEAAARSVEQPRDTLNHNNNDDNPTMTTRIRHTASSPLAASNADVGRRVALWQRFAKNTTTLRQNATGLRKRNNYRSLILACGALILLVAAYVASADYAPVQQQQEPGYGNKQQQYDQQQNQPQPTSKAKKIQIVYIKVPLAKLRPSLANDYSSQVGGGNSSSSSPGYSKDGTNQQVQLGASVDEQQFNESSSSFNDQLSRNQHQAQSSFLIPMAVVQSGSDGNAESASSSFDRHTATNVGSLSDQAPPFMSMRHQSQGAMNSAASSASSDLGGSGSFEANRKRFEPHFAPLSPIQMYQQQQQQAMNNFMWSPSVHHGINHGFMSSFLLGEKEKMSAAAARLIQSASALPAPIVHHHQSNNNHANAQHQKQSNNLVTSTSTAGNNGPLQGGAGGLMPSAMVPFSHMPDNAIGQAYNAAVGQALPVESDDYVAEARLDSKRLQQSGSYFQAPSSENGGSSWPADDEAVGFPISDYGNLFVYSMTSSRPPQLIRSGTQIEVNSVKMPPGYFDANLMAKAAVTKVPSGRLLAAKMINLQPELANHSSAGTNSFDQLLATSSSPSSSSSSLPSVIVLCNRQRSASGSKLADYHAAGDGRLQQLNASAAVNATATLSPDGHGSGSDTDCSFHPSPPPPPPSSDADRDRQFGSQRLPESQINLHSPANSLKGIDLTTNELTSGADQRPPIAMAEAITVPQQVNARNHGLVAENLSSSSSNIKHQADSNSASYNGGSTGTLGGSGISHGTASSGSYGSNGPSQPDSGSSASAYPQSGSGYAATGPSSGYGSGTNSFGASVAFSDYPTGQSTGSGQQQAYGQVSASSSNSNTQQTSNNNNYNSNNNYNHPATQSAAADVHVGSGQADSYGSANNKLRQAKKTIIPIVVQVEHAIMEAGNQAAYGQMRGVQQQPGNKYSAPSRGHRQLGGKRGRQYGNAKGEQYRQNGLHGAASNEFNFGGLDMVASSGAQYVNAANAHDINQITAAINAENAANAAAALAQADAAFGNGQFPPQFRPPQLGGQQMQPGNGQQMHRPQSQYAAGLQSAASALLANTHPVIQAAASGGIASVSKLGAKLGEMIALPSMGVPNSIQAIGNSLPSAFSSITNQMGAQINQAVQQVAKEHPTAHAFARQVAQHAGIQLPNFGGLQMGTPQGGNLQHSMQHGGNGQQVAAAASQQHIAQSLAPAMMSPQAQLQNLKLSIGHNIQSAAAQLMGVKTNGNGSPSQQLQQQAVSLLSNPIALQSALKQLSDMGMSSIVSQSNAFSPASAMISLIGGDHAQPSSIVNSILASPQLQQQQQQAAQSSDPSAQFAQTNTESKPSVSGSGAAAGGKNSLKSKFYSFFQPPKFISNLLSWNDRADERQDKEGKLTDLVDTTSKKAESTAEEKKAEQPAQAKESELKAKTSPINETAKTNSTASTATTPQQASSTTANTTVTVAATSSTAKTTSTASTAAPVPSTSKSG